MWWFAGFSILGILLCLHVALVDPPAPPSAITDPVDVPAAGYRPPPTPPPFDGRAWQRSQDDRQREERQRAAARCSRCGGTGAYLDFTSGVNRVNCPHPQ